MSGGRSSSCSFGGGRRLKLFDAMPFSKTEYASKADADDNTVCAYKGLQTTVLGKLHASGFDTKSYTDARQK